MQTQKKSDCILSAIDSPHSGRGSPVDVTLICITLNIKTVTGWRVRERTNKNDTAFAFSLCKPAGQLEYAGNGLVCFPIVFTLNIAGLDDKEKGIEVLGKGLPASGVVSNSFSTKG